jgi:hypothetical protein
MEGPEGSAAWFYLLLISLVRRDRRFLVRLSVDSVPLTRSRLNRYDGGNAKELWFRVRHKVHLLSSWDGTLLKGLARLCASGLAMAKQRIILCC